MTDAKYILTVGLEIHAELKTRTKMFCNSKNDPDESRPNVNVCPVCMGHPGTLPVINKEAVKHVLRVGAAVGGALADFTEFDRKNYFYPDIPKGYQISQYKYPLVLGGVLSGVAITRVHLEEDTGTLIHADMGTQINADGELFAVGENPRLHRRESASLVDFNRAGVPLMELVTEPVIHSAKEAAGFARELQLLLRYLGASDANMEKGEMRVEANISISQKSKVKGQKLGIKVEVKNLNSFKALERAIEYETNRQTEVLESGEEVTQETRGWDEAKQATYPQRMKEESHDYRYFPDPDLPKLMISELPEFNLDVLRKSLPELPWVKRERYKRDFAVTPEIVAIFLEFPSAGRFFESTAGVLGLSDRAAISSALNYITSDLLGLIKENADIDKSFADLKFTPGDFASLISMIQKKELSSRGAKDVLAVMYKEGGEPAAIANTEGLLQKSNEGELKKIVKTVLESHPKVVADYKGGKPSALQFLVGQGMKATRGSANPEMLASIIRGEISR